MKNKLSASPFVHLVTWMQIMLVLMPNQVGYAQLTGPPLSLGTETPVSGSSGAVDATIERIPLADGKMRVKVSYLTDTNHNYIVEYLDPPGFITMDGPWKAFPGTPHNRGILVDNAGTSQRFYRVRTENRPQRGVFATIANDTGFSAKDTITSDPSIIGEVAETGTPSDLQARLDGSNRAFSTVVTNIPSRQTYIITPENLSQINGQPVADGPHVLDLQKNDEIRNILWGASVNFVLDTTPPHTQIAGQPPAIGKMSSLALSFGGTDNLSPPAKLHYEYRHFLLPEPVPNLQRWELCVSPLEFSNLIDGTHVCEIRAVDEAGNIDPTPARVQWTVHTIPPIVTLALDPAYDSPPIGDSITKSNIVNLIGHTEPNLSVHLNTDVTVSADSLGRFVFPNTGLIPGTNFFAVTATDAAGNQGAATLMVLLEQEACRFANLEEWSVTHSVTTALTPSPVLGSVTVSDCEAIIAEGDSFQVTLEKNLSIPDKPSFLIISYTTPTFDTSVSRLMRDAFEVSLVDGSGRPLTYTIQGAEGVTPATYSSPRILPASPDACFNHSDGLEPFGALGTDLLKGLVNILRVDVSRLPQGSDAHLIFRLLNNDRDRQSQVHIIDVGFAPTTGEQLHGSQGNGLSLLVGTGAKDAGTSQRPSGYTSLLSSQNGSGDGAFSFSPPANGSSITVTGTGASGKAITNHVSGQVSGVFVNPVGPPAMLTFGVGTSNFSYGKDFGDGRPSSLRFAGGGFEGAFETFFTLGSLTYFNGAIGMGTEATNVDLNLTLSFEAPLGIKHTFSYALQLITTLNTSDPWESADYVIIANDIPATSFFVGDLEYTLQLLFGQSTAQGVTTIQQFHVLEQGTASAQLIGRITANFTGMPATPAVAITSPLNDSHLPVGTVPVVGNAHADQPELFPGVFMTNKVEWVSLNDVPVQAVDSIGNFFSTIEIRQGANVLNVVAIDSYRQTTTNTITVYGTTSADTFSKLGQLGDSIQVEYGRTSFNEWTKVLYADLAIRNSNTDPLRTPFYVGITHLSDPSLRLLLPDGVSSDGIPYYDFSTAVSQSRLETQQITSNRTLAFYNPNHVQFSYDVVVLSQLNQAPMFVTTPSLEAIVGRDYSYDPLAKDPDDDVLSYAVVSAPSALMNSQNSTTPPQLRWTPSIADAGVHDILLQAADGRGGIAEQHFLLNVVEPPPNRPPVFVSSPVEDAIVGSVYVYPALAIDPDKDALSYELLQAPTGMTIAASTGYVDWTPGSRQVGLQNVSIRASDGKGGTTIQTFSVNVQPAIGNHSPVIVSQPATTIVPGGGYYYDVEAVDPDKDTLEYRLLSAPQGMVINSTNGIIEWYPAINDLASAAVRFADDVFITGNWTSTVLTKGNASASQRTVDSGGNPGSHLRITQDISESSGAGATKLLALYKEALYDPAAQGAIFDISFRFDTLAIAYPSSSMGTLGVGPCLAQDGNYYLASTWGAGDTWRTNRTVRLTASDFGLVVSSYGTDFSQNPDFGPSGKPITFGLAAGNSARGIGLHWETAVDNFQVDLTRQASFGVSLQVEDGRGGSATQTYSVSTLGGSEIQGHVFNDENTNGVWERSMDLLAVGTRLWRLNRMTGAILDRTPVISGTSAELGPLGNIYIASYGYGVRILEAGTDRILGKVTNGIPDSIQYLTFGPDGKLYYTVFPEPRVYQADLTTMQAPRLFCENSAVSVFRDPAFGPNNNLYTVSDYYDTVYEFNGVTGSLLRTFVSDPDTSSILRLWFIEFGPDGNLYVVSQYFGDVYKFNGSSGAYINKFIPYAGIYPGDILFGPDGDLYAASSGVYRFNGESGALVGRFDVGDSTLSAKDLVFAPSPSGGTNDESTLPGWRVYVDLNRNGRRDAFEPYADTDSMGRYVISNLRPGDYMVREEVKPGWKQTSPQSQYRMVSTIPVQTTFRVDFGNQQGSSSNQNSAPLFVSLPSTNTVVNAIYAYYANAFDADGDNLTYALDAGPSGMAVDPVSGVVVWVPDENQAGNHQVVLRVSDNRGGVDTQSFQVNVSRINTAPQITSQPPSPAAVGKPYQYFVTAQDAEGDALSFSVTGGSPAMKIEKMASNIPGGSQMAVLTWTPLIYDAGKLFDVSVIVEDGKGKQAIQTYQLPVSTNSMDRAPVFTSIPRTNIWLALPYRYQVEAFDPDGDPLALKLINGPGDMALAQSNTNGQPTWLLTWTPKNLGDIPVVLEMADGRGQATRQSFTLKVLNHPINNPPLIVSAPEESALVGRTYAYDVRAEDPDGDQLRSTLREGPAGMSLDPERGSLRWVPTVEQVGMHVVTLEVSDGFLGTATQAFNIRVRGNNGPPNITSSPGTKAALNSFYIYNITATDPDGDRLSFSLGQAPTNMTLTLLSDGGGDASTDGSRIASASIQWTPLDHQAGTNIVTVIVQDGAGGVCSQQFEILTSTNAPDHPPTIISQPGHFAGVGGSYEYRVSATDPDNDPLSFQLQEAPAGMRVETLQSLPALARVTWTPQSNQVGNHVVSLTAKDGRGGSGTQRYLIQVRGNKAPVIVSTPVLNAVPELPYGYAVHATDPDGDRLTYALTQSPAGMTIDSLGWIAWTPSLSQLGSYPVRIAVSDGFGGVDAQEFSVAVGADTYPPQVALELSVGEFGNNGEWNGMLGSAVQFRVTATDAGRVKDLALRVGNQDVMLSRSGDSGVGAFVPSLAGYATVIATATDYAGNIGAITNQILFHDPNAASTLFARIISPASGTTLTKPVPVIGTITNGTDIVSYRVDFARAADVDLDNVAFEGPQFTTLTNVLLPAGTRVINNVVLAQFDPTILLNDDYVIRLAVSDGLNLWYEPALVSVTGRLKFGEFHLDFTDLSVPVAGIPITITRSYDTREANRQGDFGSGWSLGVQDAKIRKTLRSGSMFLGSRVYINTPDGRRVGFTAGYQPSSWLFAWIGDVILQPDAGVYEKLEIVGSTTIYSGGLFYGGLGDESYSPTTFRLTTKDGTVYTYDDTKGLQNVQDLNGNRLVLNRDGVYHFSSGSTNYDQSVPFIRDAQGRILELIDPAGNRLTYTYDSKGDLHSFTDQVSNVTQYNYSSARAHYLTNIVDPLGHNALNMVYDDAGRLLGIRDANGNLSEQNFDSDSNTVTFNDANGNTNIVRYDDNGNEVMKAIPGISTNLFEYDANNNLLQGVDGRGFATNFTYDASGNVASITDALSNRTVIAYNSYNKPTVVSNALGQVLRLGYDSTGNLTNVINNAGYQTTVMRDSQGRVASLTDAAGHTTTFDYTGGCSCGKPGKVINPDGTFKLTEYDSLGNTTRTVNELGAETLSFYNSAGILLWTRDPLTNYTQFFYSGPLLTNVVDALGRSTRYEYDSLNRTNAIIDAQGGVVRIEYDGSGNRTKVIDAVSNITTFVYDSGNRLTQQIDPLGHTNFFGYDAAGNRTEAIDRNGRKRTFAYDPLNRMTNELWWEGTSVVRSIVFGFNELGVQTLAADAAARYEYSYNALNQLERVLSQSAGVPDFTLLYTYTALGQVESVTDNYGVSVGSAYDNRNRLASRTWQGSGVDPARVDFAYDAAGSRTRTDRFADLAGTNRIGFTTNAYNLAGIVTNITHLGPASQVLSKYDYHFDAAYQITSWTINNQLSTLNYDLTGQLTNALNTAQSNENFNFDANGNRLGAQSGGSYVVGGNNQILSDGINRYAYDAEGNMISRSNAVTGVLTTYHWDHRNRLLNVLDYNPASVVTQTVAFVYDAMNRRLSKTVNGQVTRFLYNQDDSWADLDGTNAVTARYLHGARIDELLARQRASDGRGWYLTDHLGTVRDLANAVGAVVAHVDYSSFGQVLAVSNPGAMDRFLFTGREFDGEIQIYCYRERFYMPSLGRFLSEDPQRFSAGDPNLQRYVFNHPSGFADPFGESVAIDTAFLQTALAGARAAVARLGSVAAYYSIQVGTAWSNFATTGLFGIAVRNSQGLVDKVHGGLAQTILYGGKDGAYGLYYSLLRGLNGINTVSPPYFSNGRWTIEIVYAQRLYGLFGRISGEVIRFYE